MKYIGKVTVLIVLVLSFMSTMVLAAEQYLCVADDAHGFRYSETKKEWESITLKTDKKYVISKTDNPNYTFKITEVGENSVMTYCKSDFDGFADLHCNDIIYRFIMSKEMMNYINYFRLGDTSYTEVGKCSPF